MAARLVPVDKYLTVESNDGPSVKSGDNWIIKKFTSSGVVDWSWTVKALKPGDHELQLYLQPTVATQRFGTIELVAQGNSSLDTTTRTTSVHVHGNPFQIASQWISDNVKTIQTAVASILGTLTFVVVGVQAFTRSFRKAA